MFLLVPIIIFIVYILKTDAPLAHGKVEFHVTFKNDLTLDIYHPTSIEQQEKYPVLVS